MLSKTFLWIEDSKEKASYIFWKNLMEQLYPEVTVEGKKNNSELQEQKVNLEQKNNKTKEENKKIR